MNTPTTRPSTRRVVIVGGGISGLAAANFIVDGVRAAGTAARTARHEPPRVEVTVVEQADRVGGKLWVTEVGGVAVDQGAEALLARRPEGRELVRAAGLDDQLTHPGTTRSAIAIDGKLRPLPAGQIMGVPSDVGALIRSGILSPAGLARLPLDLVMPRTPIHGDVAVGDYIGARLGPEVVERLVEPLLGGVYAGRAERLSLDATLPAIAAAVRSSRSLIVAVRHMASAMPKNSGPVFITLRNGLGSLPSTLAQACGADIRVGTPVQELRRTDRGWRLAIGSPSRQEHLDADAVVLATPAHVTARLLGTEVPAAAAELAAISYASVVVVTLVYAAAAFPKPPELSGYLVPATAARRAVKAVTFVSTKWPHVAQQDPGLVVVRCSLGRAGEEDTLAASDEELLAAAMHELAHTTGVRELPRASRVTRWESALPQYEVGHLDRVARARAAVAAHPGLAICGAAYDGVGIPTCIASARTAATRVLDHLSEAGLSRSGTISG